MTIAAGVSAASNHDLLAYIVLAGGELPGAAFEQEPVGDNPELRRLREAFERRKKDNGKWLAESLQTLPNLVESNPIRTVRLSYRRPAENIRFGEMSIIEMLSERGHANSAQPAIEPLLLLAIFSEIAGQDPGTDRMIARTFRNDTDEFTDHLDAAVDSEFSIRDVAAKWLRRLRDRTSNDELIAEIDKLLPGESRDQAELIKNNPDSLLAMLDVYNAKTREARQSKFDPPIPELTLKQLIAAFRSEAGNYRKLGENQIAKALEATADAKHLADSLSFHGGVTGTSATSKETRAISFKQYLPALSYETGPRSSKVIVLSDAELRWSLNGWSSPDWGEIHTPLSGRWQLQSIKADGEQLSNEAFKQWLDEHKA